MLLTSARDVAVTAHPGPVIRVGDVQLLRTPLGQIVLIILLALWILRNRRTFDVFYGLSSFYFSLVPAWFAQIIGKQALVRPAGQFDYAPVRTKLFGKCSAALKAALFRNLAGAVAINSDIRNTLISYGLPIERISHVPNAVDHLRFAPNDRATTAISQELRVVHVGGWTARKRLHVVLMAARICALEGASIRVVSAGLQDDPIYAQSVLAMTETSGSHAFQFEWLGHVEQIEEVYKAADIFCLPTQAEGMPNALLEAMSSALPVIVTAVPGTTDIVTDDVEGFVLPQMPDDELARAIADLLLRYAHDRELMRRHGSAGRQRVLAAHTHGIARDKIGDFLRRLGSTRSMRSQ